MTNEMQLNLRVSAKYDELMRTGKYSHYEALCQVVREEVERERKRCINIVETYRVSVGNSRSGELAAEWTMENLREIRDEMRSGEEVEPP